MSSGNTQAASPAPLGDLEAGARSGASFDALMDVSMPVVIEIGRTTMTVAEVLQLGVGSVVQLDRSVGEPVDVYVSDCKLAQGEVVVVGEQFGIRITKVLSQQGAEAAS